MKVVGKPDARNPLVRFDEGGGSKTRPYSTRFNLEQWAINAEASGLVHFQSAAKTIRKHVEGILEYVRTRFSNGRTEGLNGKIRTITRRSFGFHSAAALISMIFLCCGGVEVTPAFSHPSGFH